MKVTNSNVINYLKSFRDTHDGMWHAKRIFCVDGFSMSVQVHDCAYCTPRNGLADEWYEAEIGFPSARPSDAIMKYCESPEDPTGTVYAYVPIRLIAEEIQRHGGFA